MPKRTIGYVIGTGGRFGRSPFFQVQLPKSAAARFDELLAEARAPARTTVAVSVSYHQPDRLRITESQPPGYEASAAPTYVRGDVMRVQGREGVSCGLDLSARWGVPALRQALREASEQAKEFIILRVPSRKRDMVEVVPDSDLSDGAILAGSVAGASLILPPEDFSDWER